MNIALLYKQIQFKLCVGFHFKYIDVLSLCVGGGLQYYYIDVFSMRGGLIIGALCKAVLDA